jgi:hypothetical protein
MRRGASVHSWPSGHATDSEEAIQFARLQNINCMVEAFPLERVNDAYGKDAYPNELLLLFNADYFVDAMLKGTVRFRSVLVME